MFNININRLLKWINGFIRNDNKYRYFTNLIKNNWLKK